MREIFRGHMHVVEEEHGDARRKNYGVRVVGRGEGRRRCGLESGWALLDLWIVTVWHRCTLLNREAGDFARLAIVEDLEVLLLEAGDGVALRVANDNGYEHTADIELEMEGFGRRLGPLLRGGDGAGTEDEGACKNTEEYAASRFEAHIEIVGRVLAVQEECQNVGGW